MESELIFKFIKFSLVGFSGLFIDFGLTYLFKERVRMNRFVANSLGFIAAVVSNYILNKIWTFSNNDPEVLVQFAKFFTISLGGLAINNLIIYLLEKRNMNFYVAKFIAIVVVVVWNFVMNYKYSFS